MPCSPTYNVTVTQVRVGTSIIDVDITALFDSGTSFTYLVDSTYRKVSQNVSPWLNFSSSFINFNCLFLTFAFLLLSSVVPFPGTRQTASTWFKNSFWILLWHEVTFFFFFSPCSHSCYYFSLFIDYVSNFSVDSPDSNASLIPSMSLTMKGSTHFKVYDPVIVISTRVSFHLSVIVLFHTQHPFPPSFSLFFS